MRKLLKRAVTAIILQAATTAVVAGTLSVRVEEPDFFKKLNENDSLTITLSGEIDVDAPARVADALEKAGTRGADVYLSSPGGNPFAAMEIGRLLRKAGANTYIGRSITQPDPELGGMLVARPAPGRCFSACALAFLGGTYRYVHPESEYGVHRFSSSVGPTSGDLALAQIVSAAISAYIREMDVDPRLFDLTVEAGSSGMRILSSNELNELFVANNGRMRPEWTIEVTEGGQYLRGVQDTVYGQGKALFYCEKQTVIFTSIYLAGFERAIQIGEGKWFHSLLVDGDMLPLSSHLQVRANGPEILAVWTLSRESLEAIASSSRVGHAMQIARDVPTFVGYEIDIPEGKASQRVGTFLRNCLRQ